MSRKETNQPRCDRMLIVGERANRERVTRYDGMLRSDPAGWAEMSIELGAFRGDEQSWNKLQSIGLVPPVQRAEIRSLNLLPPGPRDLGWWPALARAVADSVIKDSIMLVEEGIDAGKVGSAYKYIVLCGRRVTTAFGLNKSEADIPSRWVRTEYDSDSGRSQFEMLCDGERESFNAQVLIVVPHPSGANRLWNDKDYVRGTRAAMREWLWQLYEQQEQGSES